MSTGNHKPPDNRSTRSSASGQAIASPDIDPNLEVMAISGQGERSSDDAGLDVPTPADFTYIDFLHYVRLWS